MTSSINDESAATTEFPSGIRTIANESDPPNTIPTPATEFAPKGRVIDDSARGTTFWEADPTVPGDQLGENFRSDKSVEEAGGLTCPATHPLASRSRLSGYQRNICPSTEREGYAIRGMRTGESRLRETAQSWNRVLAGGWSRCFIDRW